MITINFVSKKFIFTKYYNYLVNDILVNNNLGKVIKIDKPDFGHYTNAKQLGFGFHNNYTNKVYLHHIFKNESFYPKTMIIKKTWVSKNQKRVSDFMNKQTMVVKPNNGLQGIDVRLVNNVNEVIEKTSDKEYWVLQEIVKPKLFKGRKFDFRIFHFIFKYKNNYYNILTKAGFAKVSVYDYTTKSEKGFVTNVSYNLKEGSNDKIIYEINTFMKMLEPNDKKRKELFNKAYNLIRNYSKLLVKKIDFETNKFHNKPLSQTIIYGPDIMFDDKDEIHLIETNCYPGLMIEKDEITEFQKILFKDIAQKIFIPILQNKEINLLDIKGDLFSIEKI